MKQPQAIHVRYSTTLLLRSIILPYTKGIRILTCKVKYRKSLFSRITMFEYQCITNVARYIFYLAHFLVPLQIVKGRTTKKAADLTTHENNKTFITFKSESQAGNYVRKHTLYATLTNINNSVISCLLHLSLHIVLFLKQKTKERWVHTKWMCPGGTGCSGNSLSNNQWKRSDVIIQTALIETHDDKFKLKCHNWQLSWMGELKKL